MLILTHVPPDRQDAHPVDVPRVEADDKAGDLLNPTKIFKLNRTSTVVRYLQARQKASSYYMLPLNSEDIICIRTAIYSSELLDAVSNHLRLVSDPGFTKIGVEEHQDDSTLRIRHMLRMQLEVVVRPSIDILELRYTGRTIDCSRRILDTLRRCYLQQKGEPLCRCNRLKSISLRRKFRRRLRDPI